MNYVFSIWPEIHVVGFGTEYDSCWGNSTDLAMVSMTRLDGMSQGVVTQNDPIEVSGLGSRFQV